jgi:hypothetical protein
MKLWMPIEPGTKRDFWLTIAWCVYLGAASWVLIFLAYR